MKECDKRKRLFCVYSAETNLAGTKFKVTARWKQQRHGGW